MRSWGGKIILGLVGFLIGRFVGLVIGVAIGHFLDRGVERMQSFNPYRPYRPGEREAVEEALFFATFSIMGHLAKADGRVSEHEINQAEVAMNRMQLNEEQRRRAREAFRRGKDDDFPLDQTVAEFRQRVRQRRHLILVFLETLLQSAMADGHISSEEERILMRVARGLGVPEAQFRQILNMLLAQAQFAGAGAAGAAGRSRPSLSQAYDVLGVQQSASDQEVKKAYRKLMSEHHPDKLASRGVPEEMIRVATEKTAEISKAYEMIKEARGFR